MSGRVDEIRGGVAALLVTALAVLGLAACSDSGAGSEPGSTTVAAKPAATSTTETGATTTTSGATTSAPPACSQAGQIHAWPQERRAALLVVVPSLNFNVTDLDAVLDKGVGGVLFLGSDPAPTDLASRIATARAGGDQLVPLTFMADQEGGGVQRLEGVVDPIPWARTMGSTMTPAEIQATAKRAGDQMAAAGIDMDLAPVLDVDDRPGPSATNPDGKRAFAGTADEVTIAGLAFSHGLLEAGVVPVVKHFPGLGHSTANTDMGAASTRPIDELRATDLLPFQAAIADGAPVVMVANAQVPGLTSQPASVSKEVITDLLRTELGFDGMVMTDSLSAEAISSAGLDLPEAAAASIVAGADQILFGSTLDAEQLALLEPGSVSSTTDRIILAIVAAVADGSLPEARLDDAVANVLRVKGIDLCAEPN